MRIRILLLARLRVVRNVNHNLAFDATNALRSGGVLTLVGAVADANIGFDAWQLLACF